MAETTSETTAWQQGYAAALRDVAQRAGELQGRGGVASLEGLLAELRSGLTTAPGGPGGAAAPAQGIPPEELEREWTAG